MSDFEVAQGVFLRVLLGAVLGLAIGLEREVRGRPAGMRTHMLVVVGVVLFSEVSRAFGGADPSRIAAQIVTGVGFLGAGTILRMGADIKGLTSAASIWAAAGVGMAVSVGGAYTWVAGLATALILVTLSAFAMVERRWFPQNKSAELQVVGVDRSEAFDLAEVLAEAGIPVHSVEVTCAEGVCEILLRLPSQDPRALALALQRPTVRSATWL